MLPPTVPTCSIRPSCDRGRFDRRIIVSRPDIRGREGILGVHTKNVPLAADVDLQILAAGTPGLVGADLANLVNEAALPATRQDKPVEPRFPCGGIGRSRRNLGRSVRPVFLAPPRRPPPLRKRSAASRHIQHSSRCRRSSGIPAPRVPVIHQR